MHGYQIGTKGPYLNAKWDRLQSIGFSDVCQPLATTTLFSQKAADTEIDLGALRTWVKDGETKRQRN
jgi:hypothetical protein